MPERVVLGTIRDSNGDLYLNRNELCLWLRQEADTQRGKLAVWIRLLAASLETTDPKENSTHD